MLALKITFFLLCNTAGSSANLVENGDFEVSDHTFIASWSGNGGKITLSRQYHYRGKFSLRAFDRALTDEGPCQYVPLKPGGYYSFTAYVKQLNGNRGTMQTYTATVKYQNYPHSTPIANMPSVRSGNDWFVLKGDFLAPQTGFTKSELCIQGPEAGIEFVIDDVSINGLQKVTDWKAEANRRIQSIRKHKIHFEFKIDPGMSAKDITVQIDHKRHLFGFGGFVDMNWITDSRYPVYQKAFYNLFNWATVTSLSWPSRDLLDPEKIYSQAKTAAHALKSNGVDQWDILDKSLDDSFYQEKTVDPDYLQDIYKMVHEADSSSRHFINEDDVLDLGFQTYAYSDLCEKLKHSGLNGIGAEGYFSVPLPDATLIKLHLDSLSAAGLPIWVTGMAVSHTDTSVRADLLDMALRMYFSHPSVEGVVLKDVWEAADSDSGKYTSIMNGYDFQLNAAGQRFERLLKSEWATHVRRNLESGTRFTIDAFQGEYDITILYNGVVSDKKELKLGKNDMVFEMNIQERFKHTAVKVHNHTETDVTSIQQIPSQNTVSSLTRSTITTTPSPSPSTHSKYSIYSFKCVSRTSSKPSTGQNDASEVACQGQEWMTGCSSVKNNEGEWFYKGHFIAQNNGKPVCRTFSKAGAYAVARCCQTNDLKCKYSVSPTVLGNDVTEANCPVNYLATGCSAAKLGTLLHGSYPSDNLKGCLAENTNLQAGGTAGVVCCSAQNLSCKTVTSPPSGLEKGSSTSVACGAQNGYTMTSCNGRSNEGKLSDVKIVDNSGTDECVAFNGDTEHSGKGVEAVAVCCHANQLIPLIG